MNKKIITHLCLTLIIIGFSLPSQAAISSTQTDTILVIQKESETTLNLRKQRRVFKKNQRILYYKKGDSKRYDGRIHSFGENSIIVKDLDGKLHEVEVSELKSIQRQFSLLSFLSIFVIGAAVAIPILSVQIFIFAFFSAIAGVSLLFLYYALIILGISALIFLLGFWGLRKLYKYDMKNGWKANIIQK